MGRSFLDDLERVPYKICVTIEQRDRISVEEVGDQREEFSPNPHPGEARVGVVLVNDRRDSGVGADRFGLSSAESKDRSFDHRHGRGDTGWAGTAEQIKQHRLRPVVGGVTYADIIRKRLVTGCPSSSFHICS